MISSRKRKTCLVGDCLEKPFTRGLCRRCYDSAYRMQKRGETTFEILVRQGLMLPRRTTALAEALKK